MASREGPPDRESFRIRPGAPTARSGPGSQRFVPQVLRAVSKSGMKASGAKGARPASTFGRGRVAAGMAGNRLGASARRVVIKSRFVVLRAPGAHSVVTHLRYIEREGTTRDGQRGQAYGADTDTADLQKFEARGRGDRHQFRFIVSVEDTAELEDLRGYTRELMARMEVDFETRLDWVAVDHWDTDNPHTHIVLRGKVGLGRGAKDLVIAPDYMAYGMRQRASGLATEWLGPRTDLEIQQAQRREVTQERWTGLDRTLQRVADNGRVQVARLNELPFQRQRLLLIGRLQRLQHMGLAEEVQPAIWTLSADAEKTLRALSERGDIVRTMQRALGEQRRELEVFEPREHGRTVTGRVAEKGMGGELHDKPYLVVDGIDGRTHYLKLPAGADLTALPINGIVAATSSGQEKAVDKSIATASRDGVYRTGEQLMRLKAMNRRNPQATVDVYVRRLEALRRAGIVERIGDGVWQIPSDLMQKVRRHDLRKATGLTIELRSHLPIEQQVFTIGATWLDRQLVSDSSELAEQGFGANVRSAIQSRVDFLTEHGLAEREGQRVILARNLIVSLCDQELALVGKTLQDQTGQTHRMLKDGQQATGIYRRSIQLASGRFAMLDEGTGFSLVPWRPVIEPRLGKMLTATVRGGSVSWDLGRQRGLSMG